MYSGTVVYIYFSDSRLQQHYSRILCDSLYCRVENVDNMVYSYNISRITGSYLSISPAIDHCTPSASALQIDVNNKLLHNMPGKRSTNWNGFLRPFQGLETLDHNIMLNKLFSLWIHGLKLCKCCLFSLASPRVRHCTCILFIVYCILWSAIWSPELWHPAVCQWHFAFFQQYSCSSILEIQSCLSGDINSIITWLDNKFLFLDYSKTKIMLVETHQRLVRATNFCVTALIMIKIIHKL